MPDQDAKPLCQPIHEQRSLIIELHKMAVQLLQKPEAVMSLNRVRELERTETEK